MPARRAPALPRKHQRQRIAPPRASVVPIPTHVPYITFWINIDAPFDLRRFINNPIKHALLQYIETHGPDAPPPLDYKNGVNHIYRHNGIG